MNTITKLSDKDLHSLAQEYGGNARKWQKQFAALLPEIEKRQLYRKYGSHTVYEYAAKLCGMAHPTVDEILKVHSKLADKPALSQLMADQGWSKLKVVATIATVDKQEFWAEKVEQMSRDTLITFVQELRKQGDLPAESASRVGCCKEAESATANDNSSIAGSTTSQVNELEFAATQANQGVAMFTMDQNQPQSSLFTNSTDIEELKTGFCNPMAASQKEAMTIRLNPETETKLRIFKQKLEKQTREPQDWDAVIHKLLLIAEHETEVVKIHAKCEKKQAKETVKVPGINEPLQGKDQTCGRYIPAAVRHYLKQKYHGRCAYPNCKKPAEIKHHTLRFVLNPNHNPDFIAPLCKNHERLAHLGLIKHEELPSDLWQIQLQPDKNVPKYRIDLKVNQFRNKMLQT